MAELYNDLLVTDDDLTLDDGGNPSLLSDRDCIVQDIKHMVREKGYLVQMIAERESGAVAKLMADIEIEVEADFRIRSGTAKVEQIDNKHFAIFAQTLDFGAINATL